MRKLVLGAGALASAVPAAMLMAQPVDLTTILQNNPNPVLLQTQRARGNYLGPDFWTDLAPATYSIRMPGTNLCLTRTRGAIRAEMAHLRLRSCNISTSLDGL